MGEEEANSKTKKVQKRNNKIIETNTKVLFEIETKSYKGKRVLG